MVTGAVVTTILGAVVATEAENCSDSSRGNSAVVATASGAVAASAAG